MIVFLLISVLSFIIPNFVVFAGPLPSDSQIADFLDAHNGPRRAHSAPDLSWSKEFAAKAAQWADECILELTNGVLSDTPYGELQVAASGTFSIQDALNTFVQDESSYDPAHPVLSHFTQVVWKGTTQVGCARRKCNGLLEPIPTGGGGRDNSLLDGTYYVCLYNPPGNVVGEEKKNVEV